MHQIYRSCGYAIGRIARPDIPGAVRRHDQIDMLLVDVPKEKVLAEADGQDGDIDLRRALEVVRSCSLYLGIKDRITLMPYTVERAMRIEPAQRKRPPKPLWVRKSAATLVSMRHEVRPVEPFAPNAMNDYTTQSSSRN